jgi:hypothetical protein
MLSWSRNALLLTETEESLPRSQKPADTISSRVSNLYYSGSSTGRDTCYHETGRSFPQFLREIHLLVIKSSHHWTLRSVNY